MKRQLRIVTMCSGLAGLLVAASIHAQMNSAIEQIEQRWAEVNYSRQGTEQIRAFEDLAQEAEQLTRDYPSHAEAWIWSGIVKSTAAGAKGGLGALRLVKSARIDLEKALTIDAEALQGAAYASLGTLYLNVPGWPIAFGNEEKAKQFLDQAVALAPQDIDVNYFMAEYHFRRGDLSSAEQYLFQALSAAPRPGRELADQGRRDEIEKMLQEIESRR